MTKKDDAAREQRAEELAEVMTRTLRLRPSQVPGLALLIQMFGEREIRLAFGEPSPVDAVDPSATSTGTLSTRER